MKSKTVRLDPERIRTSINNAGSREIMDILDEYGARTDLTEETEIYDREQRKTVKIDAKLEELFKDDPKALEVLGKKKGFFDF